ncbi:hypothetical protein ABID23_000288 [Bartonella silvatica]|uniref:Uncharacterized protein n=1 Tax=Bartonella silvatica TaxID=357760 RepID=A0ABV2HFA8_9HYPH
MKSFSCVHKTIILVIILLLLTLPLLFYQCIRVSIFMFFDIGSVILTLPLLFSGFGVSLYGCT